MTFNGNPTAHNLASSSIKPWLRGASEDSFPFLWQPASPEKPQRGFKSLYQHFVDISEHDGPSASHSRSHLTFNGAPASPESGFTGDDGRQRLEAVDDLEMEHSEPSQDDLWLAYDFPSAPSLDVPSKCSSDARDTPTRAGKENVAVLSTTQEISSPSVKGNLSSPSREAEAEHPTTPSPAQHRRGLLRASLEAARPSSHSGSLCSSSNAVDSTSSSSASAAAPPVATPGPFTCMSPSRPPPRSNSVTTDAGPSRITSEASDDAKTLLAPPTEPTLRRSKRKRSEPQAYVHAPALPPVKKAKIVKRAVSKGGKTASRGTKKRVTNNDVAYETAVAGPSNHAQAAPATPEPTEDHVEDQPLAETETPEEHTQRPRRTGEEVKEDTVLNIPDHACTVVSCQLRWDPYRHEDNRTHLRTGWSWRAKHFDATQLQSKAGLACFFTGCIKTPPGTKLLGHIEEDHLTLPYLCPERCGWRSSRSGYQGQHMRKTHHVMNWKR